MGGVVGGNETLLPPLFFGFTKTPPATRGAGGGGCFLTSGSESKNS